MENKVKYLQCINFSQLTVNEKFEIKARGRPTPSLSIQQSSSTSRSKQYVRQFNSSVYEKCDWVCGCDETNALFCFPCLLFGGDSSWTKSGVDDLSHLPQKIRKHEQSTKHMNNMIDLSLLGKVTIAAQIDTGCKLSITKHNELVRKNRDVLSKIINCIKFCGKFELPFRGHDETTSSKNLGAFRGLLDFAFELDSSLKTHFNTAAVFKGTSKTIQNELLDSMFNIYLDKIKEVKNAEYLAVMCDETTDICDKTHMVIVLRYELQGKPFERFLGFFNPANEMAEVLANVLLNELHTLIGNCPDKLIAQTYDGAAAVSGDEKGVQTRIKEIYSNAHFVHCYAHQPNLIMEKAASQNSSVRVFFNSLSGILTFFSRSPQRMAALENVAGRIPKSSTTCWNFKSTAVTAIHEMKDALIECCSTLETSTSRDTGHAAAGIKRTLDDPEFRFWLEFFSKVMPHIDVLFSQFQSRNIDAVKANVSLNIFSSTIQKLRDECDTVKELVPESKRRKCQADKSAAAKEVCDVILLQCRERLSFINHLEASKLLFANDFPKYANDFPNNEFTQAVEAYPMLEKDKLRTELSVLYTREDLCKTENLIDLLEVLNDHRLQTTFSETVKLIKILITTPMTTAEAERCFSTLKKSKAFLRSAMVNDRLSAVAMIAIENKMITEMKDFNERVVNDFSTSKTCRMDFIFK